MIKQTETDETVCTIVNKTLCCTGCTLLEKYTTEDCESIKIEKMHNEKGITSEDIT